MEQIKLSNRSDKPLKISLEPEGSIFSIPPSECVEIILKEESKPMELVYGKFENENVIAIWPSHGFPAVLYKGKEL